MIRTRVVWTGVAGSPYYSNFYWSGDGPSVADQAQDATIAWTSATANLVHNALSMFVESEAYQINDATGEIVTIHDVDGSTSTGTGGTDPLPYQVQALTFFGTTDIRFSRRVRGRSFMPGLLEIYNSSGAGPQETIREVVQDVYSVHIGGAVANHVVWSRPTPATETRPARVGAMSPVTSYQTSSRWSTLRSRRA